ncbi:MAG TPA: hypothetical protein VIV60_01885, partial [Polyangiaceae bacterium]
GLASAWDAVAKNGDAARELAIHLHEPVMRLPKVVTHAPKVVTLYPRAVGLPTNLRRSCPGVVGTFGKW